MEGTDEAEAAGLRDGCCEGSPGAAAHGGVHDEGGGGPWEVGFEVFLPLGS